MLGHPLLDQVDAALTGLLPEAPVEVRGEWSSLTRRSYKSDAQLGSGSAPYLDLVDHRWEGHLSGAGPHTGMAFLLTESYVYWVKAAHAPLALEVHVSLHAGDGHDRMTFAAGLGGTGLPAVPVHASSTPRMCLVAPDSIPVGRVVRLARAEGVDFFIVLFGGDSARFRRPLVALAGRPRGRASTNCP